MKIRSATREQFLAALARADYFLPDTLSSVRTLPERVSSSDQLFLIWGKEAARGDRLPHMIVAGNDIVDFLAWCNTYLAAYCPISSLCRVVDLKLANRILDWDPQPLPDKFFGAAVSLAIVEATSSHWRRREHRRPTVAGCSASLSFALAQAVIHGVDLETFEELSGHWTAMRDEIDASEVFVHIDAIHRLWMTLRLAINEATSLKIGRTSLDVLAVRSLLKGEVLPLKMMCELCETELSRTIYTTLHEGDREARVSAYESVLYATRTTSPHAGLVVGYAASRIAPGTLEHLELLHNADDQYPAAAMWFALAASLAEPTDIWNTGGALARRLRRRLQNVPRWDEVAVADISAEEFSIARMHKSVNETVLPAHVNELCVELVPGVVTVVKWPLSREAVVPSRSPKEDKQLSLRSTSEAHEKTEELVAAHALIADVMDLISRYSSRSRGQFRDIDRKAKRTR